MTPHEYPLPDLLLSHTHAVRSRSTAILYRKDVAALIARAILPRDFFEKPRLIFRVGQDALLDIGEAGFPHVVRLHEWMCVDHGQCCHAVHQVVIAQCLLPLGEDAVSVRSIRVGTYIAISTLGRSSTLPLRLLTCQARAKYDDGGIQAL